MLLQIFLQGLDKRRTAIIELPVQIIEFTVQRDLDILRDGSDVRPNRRRITCRCSG
jgi:hypothetical protein